MNALANYIKRNPATLAFVAGAAVLFYFVVPINERNMALATIGKTAAGSAAMRFIASLGKQENDEPE